MNDLDGSSFVVLLARQRSGTNALRSVLDAHLDIFCMPEIFHPRPSPEAHLEVETNYFNFLERHTKGDIKSVMVSAEAQESVFVAYLAYLRSFSNERYVLLDIKYNSTHHLDPPWRQMTAEPGLFALIKKHGLKVLNLTRRNYLRYHLSNLKSRTTRRFTLENGGDAQPSSESHGVTPYEDPTLAVIPTELRWDLELCQWEDQLIARNLAGYAGYLAADYADLFSRLGHPPSARELGRIAEWLAISPFEVRVPQYRKQATKSLEATIANYEEIQASLRGTPFEYCLEDEPINRDA